MEAVQSIHGEGLIGAIGVVTGVVYFVFAAQLALQAGASLMKPAGRALTNLSVVFILCALVSYIGPALGIPGWLHDGMMLALFVGSLLLVITNQAGVVAAMLRRDDDI